MDVIFESIIKDWKTLNNDVSISNLKIKHLDHNLGIYTLYFDSNKEKIRIKALKNPYTKLQTLTRYLQGMFRVEVKDTWKIINMT